MEHTHHTMDRNIFNLNLSVPATSAYIVVTSLLAEGKGAPWEGILARWTASEEDLETAIDELMNRNVLREGTGPDNQRLFWPNPSGHWRW